MTADVVLAVVATSNWPTTDAGGFFAPSGAHSRPRQTAQAVKALVLHWHMVANHLQLFRSEDYTTRQGRGLRAASPRQARPFTDLHSRCGSDSGGQLQASRSVIRSASRRHDV